uniref:ELMO domain containing 3 n=1 Tax=Nothoprocta perdicaria TaxID=30464 RepID=A0A8C6YXY8_NOTPE
MDAGASRRSEAPHGCGSITVLAGRPMDVGASRPLGRPMDAGASRCSRGAPWTWEHPGLGGAPRMREHRGAHGVPHGCGSTLVFTGPSLPAGLLGFPPGPIPKNPAFSVLLSPPQKAIPARPRRRGLASLLHMLFGPPRLRAPLQAERDLALAIARCALDDSERVHVRILQTIYRRLTRSPLGCPRYGAHWEELGFQGADPGTDLRGTGMLGLLQMLHFVTDPRTLPLARKIFKLSQHETQHFPFCVVSVNVTRIVVRALRDERLSRECNRRRQVLAVLNDVYVGAFLRLYGAWTARRGALPDAGALLKLETFTKKKPRQLLKALESYLSGSAAAPAGAREDRDFTGICDLPAEAADAVRPL